MSGQAYEKKPNSPVTINRPSPGMLSSAFREVHANPPAVVKSTAKKYGAKRAEKQRIAIALNKARG